MDFLLKKLIIYFDQSQVPGARRSVSVDLRKLDISEDWECQNKTSLNTFNISISASTTDSRSSQVFTGPSSKSITVQPPCSGRLFIGRDQSRLCSDWLDHDVATPALLCHTDTAQDNQSNLRGAFLFVFMA